MDATKAQPLSFTDRLALATAQVNLTFERRDCFLSDDDVLDAAADNTVSISTDWGDDDLTDYELLRDSLFDLLAADATDTP